MISKAGAWPLSLLLLFAAPARAAAGGAMAVLSSDTGAYMEAFTAFQASYGAEVPFVNIADHRPEVPPGTSVIVAFGGKAANYAYPAGIPVVYCMAPGLFMPSSPGTRTVKVMLVPEFGVMFSELKAIQPAIKRLRVFWSTPSFARYQEAVTAEGLRNGVEVTTVRVTDVEDMPSLLRKSYPMMDAFWVPPDPMLVTPENLMIMKEFSWGNGIPFYGSTKGMTREGAAASIGASFRDMGETAALAAARLAAGEPVPDTLSPEKFELTLNASAARRCGLKFPPEVLRRASYLFP